MELCIRHSAVSFQPVDCLLPTAYLLLPKYFCACLKKFIQCEHSGYQILSHLTSNMPSFGLRSKKLETALKK